MKAKEVFDSFFKDVSFDARLYKKLVYNNVDFITRDADHTQLFSGRNVGCYFIKYTMFDKNIFYNSLFDVDYDDVVDQVEKITSIPASFKVARDDINLVTFYIAHRFLSNDKLSQKQRVEYAMEALNYFSYRTLVLITSNYFVYPISEQKATTLTEQLSNKYVIKTVKNWSEYCSYRSQEFVKSKFLDTLMKMDDDQLPNAISDLYSRTKDTIKNIYVEFMEMIENGEVIKSKNAVVIDSEGKETLVDRIETLNSYVGRVESYLSERSLFVRLDVISVVSDILPVIDPDQFTQCLDFLLEHSIVNRASHDRVTQVLQGVVLNAISYLQRNEIHLTDKSSLLAIINALVGNVLYARGTDVEVNGLKTMIDKLLKEIYKSRKKGISDRNLKTFRNGLYIYIVLLSLLKT